MLKLTNEGIKLLESTKKMKLEQIFRMALACSTVNAGWSIPDDWKLEMIELGLIIEEN